MKWLLGLGVTAIAAGCAGHASPLSSSPPPAPPLSDGGGAADDGGAADAGEPMSPLMLVAGAHHTCVLLPSGAVSCRGDNTSGQLGRSPPGDPLNDAFVNLGMGQKAKAIVAGTDHTCAILDNGRVKCWGENDFGQLGLEDIANRGDGTLAMGDALAFVDLGEGQTVKSLAAGSEATCALLDTGLVKCWGNAYEGALGYGSVDTRGASAGSMGDNLPTVDLGSKDGVPFRATAIAAVDYHSFCAILDDTGDDNSGLKCWGSNDYCELDLGSRAGGRGAKPEDMGNNLEWTDIGTTHSGAVRKAVALAGGYQYMCALGSDGAIKCWGENVGGQLGIGVKGTAFSCAPNETGNAGLVTFDSPAVAIAARGPDDGGGAHTCALLASGAVRCWGENANGQLGTGDTGDRITPSDPLVFSDGFTPNRLVAGYQFTCALGIDDRAQCWGNNAAGQLGADVPGEVHAPGTYIRLRGPIVRSIAAGSDHTCAVLANGGLKCWGHNADGQLGTGDQTDRGTAAEQLGDHLLAVGLTGRVSAVAAGSRHTCALLEAGTVFCWGSNDAGELGQGDKSPRLAPPPSAIPLDQPAAGLAAGVELTCALLRSGTVSCWGLNDDGQLGIGDTMDRSTPIPPIDLGSPAIAIAAGDRHVCALLTNGKIRCWGDNADGQLGVGDTIARSTPTDVPLGAHTARAIAARGADTCALLDNDAVTCWGANASGQLGMGDTSSRSAPDSSTIDLGTGRSAVALSVGEAFACALLDIGQAKCWGDNGIHQLGGSLTGQTYGGAPDQMGDFLPIVLQGGGRSVRSIGSGRAHSCALLDTGDVRCWGDNSFGQLGAGDVETHFYYLNPTSIVDLGGQP